LTCALAASLKGLAFAAAVHDDDILALFAAANGQPVFRYNSFPNYFDGVGEPTPNPDNAPGRASPQVDGEDALLAALGGNVDGYELHRLLWSPGDFVFATELHAALARVIGLPAYTAGFGYDYAERGDLMTPLSAAELTKTGV